MPSTTERLPTYGGQAVIEGVMMRGARFAAVAMRAPDQTIAIHTEPLGPIYQSRWATIPFLRGVVMLWDALALGMRALTLSANMQSDEDEKIEGASLYLTMGLSLAITIGLFFVLPALLGHVGQFFMIFFGAPNLLPAEAVAQPAAGLWQFLTQANTTAPTWAAWWSNLLEGIVRLGLLIGYIYLVGRMPEIARVFGYHGAEHKTINAFEAGAELTPETVATYSLEHPRCGTAFLLTLMVLSVLLFSLLGPLPFWLKLVTRVLMIPVLAGIAYEYIRWTARNLHRPIVRWMIIPNLALQRMTTRQPSLDMLEVAIAAFQTMRSQEEARPA